ncbi:MAG: SprT-like domain-containing protein [Lachnospiraceae bacterium]|nr:SprT-like domain-containing protein [Lachnospiraceae bacterium]
MLKDMQATLERAYEVLNNVYFDSALPTIVITIMSSPRTNGHFTLGKVWRAEENHYNEINISAEHLKRPIEEICATLCHEMVHYYCYINGIADVSQNGRYHNKNFKREAEKRGLIISYQQYIGYSVTKPSKEFTEVLKANNIEKPIDINRDGEKRSGNNGTGIDGKAGTDNGIELPKKPKCSTRKYQCPCCKNSFRATKDINVLCMDCNVQYEKIEKVDNSEV